MNIFKELYRMQHMNNEAVKVNPKDIGQIKAALELVGYESLSVDISISPSKGTMNCVYMEFTKGDHAIYLELGDIDYIIPDRGKEE